MGFLPGGIDYLLLKCREPKNDHPGYSFERAPWALVTGVGPLNSSGWANHIELTCSTRLIKSVAQIAPIESIFRNQNSRSPSILRKGLPTRHSQSQFIMIQCG